MTYKEYFERLSFEYDQASKDYHKFRGRLSKTRQHKLGGVSKYSLAKNKFEIASKAYWSFLNFWVNCNFDINSEFRAGYLGDKTFSFKAGKWIESSQNYTFN